MTNIADGVPSISDFLVSIESLDVNHFDTFSPFSSK